MDFTMREPDIKSAIILIILMIIICVIDAIYHCQYINYENF